MDNLKELGEFAPFILMVLMFFWQNNVFVRPEKLEEKHRKIMDEVNAKIEKAVKEDIAGKYVELNAYKEFQAHVYSELNKANQGINDIREILINRG